jgi:hypothetical protein
MNKIETCCHVIGSFEVSAGTLRAQDLIPAFLNVLREVHPEGYQQAMIPACGFAMVPAHALEDEDAEWWGKEASHVLEHLFDVLNEHSPEGFTFGAHEGDGACFGYWPIADDLLDSHSYDWPPSDPDAASDWASDHSNDAIAYAAGWTQSGTGYGPKQAKAEWPLCPGFDWADGLPDWDCGLTEESDFEYRTVLMDQGGYFAAIPKVNGWELVNAFGINPEPELHDEEGKATGVMYIGEHCIEAVYRRRNPEEDYTNGERQLHHQ